MSEHQPAGTVVRVLTSRTSEKPDKRLPLKQLGAFVASTLVGGLLIVVPIYLAVLLLLNGMPSVAGLARPLALLVSLAPRRTSALFCPF